MSLAAEAQICSQLCGAINKRASAFGEFVNRKKRMALAGNRGT
jgi:hypothetical protein